MILGPRGTAGLVRFVFTLVTRAWGWTVIGIILIIVGLSWGAFSHQVAYVQGNQGAYQTFWNTDGFIIFQQTGTSNYYVIHIPDFSPDMKMSSVLANHHLSFTFSASTDSIYLDSVVVGTGQPISYAHPIEKITFYDPNGQNPQTFTNAEYSGNPTGYTINYWPEASLLILAGIVCVSVSASFTLKERKRRKLAVAAHLAELKNRPSPFARELAEMATQSQPQPYQGVAQYPPVTSTVQVSTPYQKPQK